MRDVQSSSQRIDYRGNIHDFDFSFDEMGKCIIKLVAVSFICRCVWAYDEYEVD